MRCNRPRASLEAHCHPPFLLALVGPNGSGKSSLQRAIGIGGDSPAAPPSGRARWDPNTGELSILAVNPDDIARAIMRENPAFTTDEANLAAQTRAEEIRNALVDERLDFAMETVGSHPSKVDFLRNAKQCGYTVAVIFISTESADINVARVANRVAQGGHDVPEDKIRRRYERSLALLPEYYKAADVFEAFDNSDKPKLLIIKTPDSVVRTDHFAQTKWVQSIG